MRAHIVYLKTPLMLIDTVAGFGLKHTSMHVMSFPGRPSKMEMKKGGLLHLLSSVFFLFSLPSFLFPLFSSYSFFSLHPPSAFFFFFLLPFFVILSFLPSFLSSSFFPLLLSFRLLIFDFSFCLVPLDVATVTPTLCTSSFITAFCAAAISDFSAFCLTLHGVIALCLSWCHLTLISAFMFA